MEQQPQPTSLFQLNIDANTGYTLKSAASWAKIVGILGIIFGLLFVAGGLLFQNMISSGGMDEYGYRGNSNFMSTAGTMGMVMYILCGLLILIGSLFALNFGNRIGTALRANDQNALRSGFAAARNYFAYWAIFMIIGLLLALIGIVGGATSGM